MSSYITKHAKENGLRVVDATSDAEIYVLAADIKGATQKNSKCCAFARAAKRQDPKVKRAYFFRSVAWLEYDDKIVRYTLPVSVQKEIVSFDRSKMMDPGLYQINKPRKSTRMSAIKARSAKRPGRHKPGNGTIKRKYRHATTSIRTPGGSLSAEKNAQ